MHKILKDILGELWYIEDRKVGGGRYGQEEAYRISNNNNVCVGYKFYNIWFSWHYGTFEKSQ